LSRDHLDLHSFPTRRSSDLEKWLNTLLITFWTSFWNSLVEKTSARFFWRVSNQPVSQTMPMPCASAPAKTCWNRSAPAIPASLRSEEHTSELQSRENLVCRL